MGAPLFCVVGFGLSWTTAVLVESVIVFSDIRYLENLTVCDLILIIRIVVQEVKQVVCFGITLFGKL